MKHANNITRLRHLHDLGVHYREQMEAMATECRNILGCGDDESSLEADWCDEIVLQGTSPEVVVEKINARAHKGV